MWIADADSGKPERLAGRFDRLLNQFRDAQGTGEGNRLKGGTSDVDRRAIHEAMAIEFQMNFDQAAFRFHRKVFFLVYLVW